MDNNVMFSRKTDAWATPQGFFDELDREFHFEMDVCATPENANAGGSTRRSRTDLRSHGRAGCGATRRMAGKLASG